MCYIDSELWKSKFEGLLRLVKEYIFDVWEIQIQIIIYIMIVTQVNNSILNLHYNYRGEELHVQSQW